MHATILIGQAEALMEWISYQVLSAMIRSGAGWEMAAADEAIIVHRTCFPKPFALAVDVAIWASNPTSPTIAGRLLRQERGMWLSLKPGAGKRF